MNRLGRILLQASAGAILWSSSATALVLSAGVPFPDQLASTRVDACAGDVLFTTPITLFDCFGGEPFGLSLTTASATDTDTGTTSATSGASASRADDTASGTATAVLGTSVGAESLAIADAGAHRTAQAGALATWLGVFEIGADGTDVDLSFLLDNGADTDGLFLGTGVSGATALSLQVSAVDTLLLGDLTTPDQLNELSQFIAGNLFSGAARLDSSGAAPTLTTSGGFDGSGITASTTCETGSGTCVDFSLPFDFNDLLIGNIGDTVLVGVSLAVASEVDADATSGGTASADVLDTVTLSVTSTSGIIRLQPASGAPEPGTIVLIVLGLACAGGWSRSARASAGSPRLASSLLVTAKAT